MELAVAAMESSLVTHGDIRAGAFAYGVAAATAALVNGALVGEVWSMLPKQVANVEREWLTGRQSWAVDRSGMSSGCAGETQGSTLLSLFSQFTGAGCHYSFCFCVPRLHGP